MLFFILEMQYGRIPEDLSLEKSGSQEFERVKKEIEDFDLNIYLNDSDFEQTFKTAIQVQTPPFCNRDVKS
jgi:hypothetical protein